jgi:hypothetical protein
VTSSLHSWLIIKIIKILETNSQNINRKETGSVFDKKDQIKYQMMILINQLILML